MSAKGFDPAELLQVLVDIARSGSRAHITSEYRRCVNGSSAGSGDTTSSPPPAPPPSETSVSTLPTGRGSTAGHIEDENTWFIDQDRNEKWIRHCYDLIDPKSWK